MPDQGLDFAALSTQTADAVARVAASTVRVSARRGPSASGIVLAPDLILTADHVVDQSREDSIRLGLPDGSEAAGTLAGRDPNTDLALLRLAGGTLTPATPAEGEPRTGAIALAVARPGAEAAASLGLIVGVGGPARTRRGGVLERFIQVDVVLYPGFSGGPLIDAAGNVLGLNTSGLGFGGPSIAIPWAQASRLAGTIAQHGKVPRGYLGVGSQPVPLAPAARDLAGGQERGLLVVQVADGGPAAQAGVLQGDILVKLAETTITNADDLQGLLTPERVSSAVDAVLVRGGELKTLSITIGSR